MVISALNFMIFEDGVYDAYVCTGMDHIHTESPSPSFVIVSHHGVGIQCSTPIRVTTTRTGGAMTPRYKKSVGPESR
jgi:hypothetical protein